MRARWLWLWFSGAVLLPGALLALVAPFVPLSSEPLLGFWEESAGSLSVFLALPLLPLVVVFLAQCGLESGPYTLSKGELDCLLQLKHKGALLHRSRRMRESAARISLSAPSASRSTDVGLAHLAAPEQGLDRLVQLKRRGAWAPHISDAFQPSV